MTRGDPGVPEALYRAGRLLGEELNPDRIDRLWVFPPAARGRRERGLLVASLLLRDDPDRRLLTTLRYTAEETGKGVTFDPVLREEGVAPPDRIPRIIAGVVRRSAMDGGGPREISIEGDSETFQQWLAGLDPAGPQESAP